MFISSQCPRLKPGFGVLNSGCILLASDRSNFIIRVTNTVPLPASDLQWVLPSVIVLQLPPVPPKQRLTVFEALMLVMFTVNELQKPAPPEFKLCYSLRLLGLRQFQ